MTTDSPRSLAVAIFLAPGTQYAFACIAVGMSGTFAAADAEAYSLAAWLTAATLLACLMAALPNWYPSPIARRQAAYMARHTASFFPGIPVRYEVHASRVPGFAFVEVVAPPKDRREGNKPSSLGAELAVGDLVGTARYVHGYVEALWQVKLRIDALGAWPLIRPVAVSRAIMEVGRLSAEASREFAQRGRFPDIPDHVAARITAPVSPMCCARFWSGYARALLEVHVDIEALGFWPLIRRASVTRALRAAADRCDRALPEPDNNVAA